MSKLSGFLSKIILILSTKQFGLKTFDFLADRLPFGYAFNFDNYLFNKIRHIQTQEVVHRADYFIINNVKKRIEGKIHFLIQDRVAYSPYKSLFGSFEFNPRLHSNLLEEFWSFIESDLRTREIKKVVIVSFAECYAPLKARKIHETLVKNEFSITLKATNHHIRVGEDLLENRMHPMEWRRFRKCQKEGFNFREEPPDCAGEVYDFLAECRREQHLELSISREKWMQYCKVFPQNYPFFSVRDTDGEILAATITIIPQRQILYTFLPGSLRRYKHFSPSVMLYHGLYAYCRQRSIDLLDLGISTEKNGSDQKSLIAFKERLGGQVSYKYFYEKRL